MIPLVLAILAIQQLKWSGVKPATGLCARIVTMKFIPLAFLNFTDNRKWSALG